MWYKTARVEFVQKGKLHPFFISGRTVVLAVIDNGSVVSFDGECPHRGGPLKDGELSGSTVICPWHRFEFSLESGKPVLIPYSEKYGSWRSTGDLILYRNSIRDGEIWVEVP
ncbi:MAG: Rieske (2Fe-2S) protein [Methanomassiliicoccales archaeon]